MIYTEIESIPHALIDRHIFNMPPAHRRSYAHGSKLVCTSDAPIPLTSLTVYGNTNGSSGVGDPTDKGLYEIPVSITGKNLFNYHNPSYLRGYMQMWVGSKKPRVVGSDLSYTYYIDCLPDTTYTFSRTTTDGAMFRLASSAQEPRVGMEFDDILVGDPSAKYITWTTGAADKYLFFSCADILPSDTVTLNGWQIEQGAEASPLEEHHTPQHFSLYSPSQLFADTSRPYKLTLYSSKKTILTDLYGGRHRMTDITDIQELDTSPMLYAGTNIISVNTSVKPSELAVYA